MYEKIQEKYGSFFKNKLRLENLICAVDISMEECEQGAGNLAKASQNTAFRMRHWGRVTINRHNTLIQGDFHAFIRYDLPPEEESEIATVAHSFDQALDALDVDREFLKVGGVMSDDMIDSYIELKMGEVQRLRMATHPVEFDMYYSV